jgi:hypothetical protein
MIDALVRALAPDEAESPLPLPPGVVVRRARWLPALGGVLAGMSGPAAAVTLGRTIVVHPAVPVTRRLLRHELAHVRQWQQSPLVFPLRYAWYSLRHGYTGNPFEVEARRAESD